jgi:hypothetical protein
VATTSAMIHNIVPMRYSVRLIQSSAVSCWLRQERWLYASNHGSEARSAARIARVAGDLFSV